MRKEFSIILFSLAYEQKKPHNVGPLFSKNFVILRSCCLLQ